MNPIGMLYYIVENISFILIPLISFIVIYSFVIDYGSLSSKWGLTRVTISFLVVGSFFGFLGNIPIFGMDHTIIAINIGGAIIPLTLSYIFIKKIFDSKSYYIFFIAGVVIFVVGNLFIFIYENSPFINVLYSNIPLYCLIFTAILDISIIPFFTKKVDLIASMILLEFIAFLTYSITVVVPSQGIESSFPYYLMPSIAASFISLFIWRKDNMRTTLASYFSSTIGVLTGADIFHQPSLYGPKISIIGSIGGAGPMDMVFQAGLISFAITLLFIHWNKINSENRLSEEENGIVSRSIYLTNALSSLKYGKYKESMDYSKKALDVILNEFMQMTSSFSINDLSNIIPVKYFNSGDYYNMSNIYDSKTYNYENAYDVYRASIHMISLLDEFKGRYILANFKDRFIANAIDIVIFTVPLFLILLFKMKGLPFANITNFIQTIQFNLIMLFYTSLFIIYVILSEYSFGKSMGKYFMNLEVRAITYRSIGFVQSLTRNITRLPMLYLLFAISTDSAITMDLLFFALNNSPITIVQIVINIVIFIMLLLLLTVVIPYSFMKKGVWRQRFGDFIGNTVVIKSNWKLKCLT